MIDQIEVMEKDKARDFLKNKMEEGCLVLREEHLGHMPDDYIEVVAYIMKNGMLRKHAMPLVVIMDDDETKNFHELLKKEIIELFILSDREKEGARLMWNLALMRDQGNKEKPIYVGGENLRVFCDRENIYYKSLEIGNGNILSHTDFKWQKNENDDCRKPVKAH